MWKRSQPSRSIDRTISVGGSDKVEVTALKSRWCLAANLVYERARRAADELGPDVELSTIDMSDRDTLARCGRTDQVLVDGRPLQRAAPPSYKAVRRKIARQLRR